MQNRAESIAIESPLRNSPPVPLVIFAHVPPPEHGQSRMVSLMLDALRRDHRFEVAHVNAAFSSALEDVGKGSIGKVGRLLRYLNQARRYRAALRDPWLYYVPGPVKWSAVLRDWVLLAALRGLYGDRVIFHWHASGQGEWAAGSTRAQLPGPAWLESIARKISSAALDSPAASIVVSPNAKDAAAVDSQRTLLVPNGVEDPCLDFADRAQTARVGRQVELRRDSPRFRLLFLSHGTIQKGVTDALEAVHRLLHDERVDSSWSFDLTLAGGIAPDARAAVDRLLEKLKPIGPRLRVVEVGYVRGETKAKCYQEHDIFLAPNRWESFGITVAEAMAHGLPVVAAASDGAAGVLPENYPFLASVGDPRELAEALIAICGLWRSGEAAALGEQLRERFLANFLLPDFQTGIGNALAEIAEIQPSIPSQSPQLQLSGTRERPLRLSAYLGDQNPGFDRSLGISRMSEVILRELANRNDVALTTVSSRTSLRGPEERARRQTLPWGTRSKFMRVLTDNLHPLLAVGRVPDVRYFPKGFLPRFGLVDAAAVVTVHDTIIQHYCDHYPEWRKPAEYAYWAEMLKFTLLRADGVFTVSEHSKQQILSFMERFGVPQREILVTYEPCIYEPVEQPVTPEKGGYALHLGSREPHKMTAPLVKWWLAQPKGKLPPLHLVGHLAPELEATIAGRREIVRLPHLSDGELQKQITAANVLVLPSEIEGFGLPAVEAYYLGTPVCHVENTSVEEILAESTAAGRFTLSDWDSLGVALDEALALSPEEVRRIGLDLRERFAGAKVVEMMVKGFRSAIH